MISAQIDLDLKSVSSLIKKVSDPKELKTINQVGATTVASNWPKHYREAGRELWLNRSLSTHGPGRKKSRWWESTASRGNYKIGSVDKTGAEVIAGVPYLAHKVTGGTIKPKRTKYLTIPLIPEAHGKRARQYQQDNRSKLFRIGNALMEAVESGGTSAAANRATGARRRRNLRAVYALVKSVDQKPWPNALPADEEFIEWFAEGIEIAIDSMVND